MTSHDDIRRCMTAAEDKAAQGAKERRRLEAELRGAELKPKLMKDWMKSVTDDNETAATAVLRVAVVVREMTKVTEKRNEFERRLRDVEAKSDRRIIRLQNFLVKQTCIDKI